MKNAFREERLKDRRAYRQALIQKREEIEAKIKRVEQEIRDLSEVKRAA